jgi:hypothetical protein
MIRTRGLIRDWKVDVICLQETKLECFSREVVRSLWGCLHVDWCYLGVRGASRGILLKWYRRVVEKMKDCVGRFSIACSFRSVCYDLSGHLQVYMVQIMTMT